MLNFIFVVFDVEEKINDNNSNPNNRSKIKTKVIKILIFLFNSLNSHDRARIPINVTTLSEYMTMSSELKRLIYFFRICLLETHEQSLVYLL